MSRSSLVARLFLCAGVLLLALISAVPSPAKGQPAKPAKFFGEVMNVNTKAMQVRGQQNKALIHIFSYSPSASAQIAKVLAKGGYHYGDKVVIDYMPGSDVALRIKGKPSKVG
jgi:hypothetical protein